MEYSSDQSVSSDLTPSLLISYPPSSYSLLGQKAGKEKTLALCKYCSETVKVLVSYKHCLSHKYKTQSHTGYYEES